MPRQRRELTIAISWYSQLPTICFAQVEAQLLHGARSCCSEAFNKNGLPQNPPPNVTVVQNKTVDIESKTISFLFAAEELQVAPGWPLADSWGVPVGALWDLGERAGGNGGSGKIPVLHAKPPQPRGWWD